MFEVVLLLLCAFIGMVRENIGDYNEVDACERYYHLEYGQKKILACDIPEGFIGVFWYRENITRPLISYTTENGLSGHGYTAGEYEITTEGSLQINNVSFRDEANFRIRVVYPLQHMRDFKNYMTVTVYVKPVQPYPLIDICQGRSYCFAQVNTQFTFSCAVHGARPNVGLVWLWGNGTRAKPQTVRTTQDDNRHGFYSLSSSVATVDVFLGRTSPLGVLFCKYHSPYIMMEERESIVLFKNKEAFPNLPDEVEETKIFTANHKAELRCIDKAARANVEAVLWEKRSLSGQSIILGHLARGRSTTIDSNMKITTNGSLILKDVQISLGGDYFCVVKDSSKFVYRRYSVETYVHPVPNFPIIISCPKYRNCAIPIKQRTGHLKCKLQRIRPEVKLEWIYAGKGRSPIEFSDIQPVVSKDEGGYDISLTANYKIMDGQGSQDIQVACLVRGSVSERFTNTSYITLTYTAEKGSGMPKSSFSSVCVICLLLLVVFGF